MPSAAKPDFLIIGAPETATAVLYDALAAHPQVHVPTAGLPADHGQLLGDLAPYVLGDLDEQARRPGLASAKLISVVRDPIDRAFASWTRLRATGQEPEADFVRAVERPSVGDTPARYRELGLYGEQFTHLFTQVDPRQNLILRHRDVLDHAELSVNRACELLGIDTGLVDVQAPADGTDHHARPRPTAEQRAALLPLFESDIESFARLVGQEFQEWLEDRSSDRHALAAD
jgi:hypothetical protein